MDVMESSDESLRSRLRRAYMTGRRADFDAALNEVSQVIIALEELTDAADVHLADQSGATDPRCGLTQPITVAQGESLAVAYRKARESLANAV